MPGSQGVQDGGRRGVAARTRPCGGARPRGPPPARAEVLDELDWVMAWAVGPLGEPRAARYLRKFYPWYLAHLDAGRAVQDALQRTDDIAGARAVLAGLRPARAA